MNIWRLNPQRTFVDVSGAHPETREPCEFRICCKLIMHKHKYGPDDVYYNLKNVPFVMASPGAIFKGLDRDGHSESYCYVSKPARRWINESDSRPTPDGFVFLVFVTKGFEIFDWRFERADDIEVHFPKNYEQRFGPLIWRKGH